jgi:hypothetical protein
MLLHVNSTLKTARCSTPERGASNAMPNGIPWTTLLENAGRRVLKTSSSRVLGSFPKI